MLKRGIVRCALIILPLQISLRYDLPPLNGQLTYSSSGNNDVLSCLAALLLLMGLQPLRGYRSQPNYDL